jgi:hypothetical protein
MRPLKYAAVALDALRELIAYQSAKALELYREVFR